MEADSGTHINCSIVSEAVYARIACPAWTEIVEWTGYLMSSTVNTRDVPMSMLTSLQHNICLVDTPFNPKSRL